MMRVSIDNLSISFPSAKDSALRQCATSAFSVGEGQTFGLIGPSGCGKTTVLRAIAGLNTQLDRRDRCLRRSAAAGQEDHRSARRNIQMVFQDPYSSLHPRHRIARILGEPLKAIEASTESTPRSRRSRSGRAFRRPSPAAIPTSCPAASASVSPLPARCF
jgi:peptide/nickel transport system ATP-binding protein